MNDILIWHFIVVGWMLIGIAFLLVKNERNKTKILMLESELEMYRSINESLNESLKGVRREK